MSFTYFNTDIAATSSDYTSFVRFMLDDKDSTAYELENEEITALYNETTGTQVVRNYQTAIKAAKYLWRKYSKQVTFSSAGTSMQLSERANHWWQVIQTLQGELNIYTGMQPVLYPQRTASFRW